jgi:glycosyltransferase involved in cell wall biosynthesis
VREELSLPAGTPLVGSVAIFYRKGAATRMVPPEVHEKHLKGHADLIRAMPFVLAEFPQARLLLAGSGWGPEGQAAESEVRAMAVAEGLGDRVIFLGYRTDIAEIYMDLDASAARSNRC